MCTAVSCLQWKSTVYTYHIHLISPNEISTDLLFTMHRRATAARHRATTHTHTCTQRCTHMHTHTQAALPSASESQCQRGREKLIVFLKPKSLCPQITDRPMGFDDLIEEGGNYSFHSIVYTYLCCFAAQSARVLEPQFMLSEKLLLFFSKLLAIFFSN